MNKKMLITISVSVTLAILGGLGIQKLSKGVVSPDESIKSVNTSSVKNVDSKQEKIINDFDQLLNANKSTGDLIEFIQKNNSDSSEETNNYIVSKLLEVFDKNSQIDFYQNKLNDNNFDETGFYEEKSKNTGSDKLTADDENQRIKALAMYLKLYKFFRETYTDKFDSNSSNKSIKLGKEFAEKPELIAKIQDEELKILIKELVNNGYVFEVSGVVGNDPWSTEASGRKYKTFHIAVAIDMEKVVALSKGMMKDYLSIVNFEKQIDANVNPPRVEGNPSDMTYYRWDEKSFEYIMTSYKKVVIDSGNFLAKHSNTDKKIKGTIENYEKTYTEKFFKGIFYDFGTYDFEKITIDPVVIDENFGKSGKGNVQIIYSQLKDAETLNTKFGSMCAELRQLFDRFASKEPLTYKVLYSKDIKDFANKYFAEDDIFYEKRISILKKYFKNIKISQDGRALSVDNKNLSINGFTSIDGKEYCNITFDTNSDLYIDVRTETLLQGKTTDKGTVLEEINLNQQKN